VAFTKEHAVAVRKFFLNIGQSNAGPSADAASWWALHPNLDIRSSDPNIFATNFPRGSYSDTYTFPAGVFPQHGTVNLKGTAIQSLRYLTFYDPMATGYIKVQDFEKFISNLEDETEMISLPCFWYLIHL
jgi:hypothetical protein